MKQWIENLLALQDVDMRIKNLKLRLEMMPKEKQNLNQKMQDQQAKLALGKESYQKTELAIKQTESEIAKVNDSINQLQQKSSLVKKNTEYKAMMTEIENFKSKISDFETKEITLLDQLEVQKEEFKEFEKQFNAEKNSIKEEIEELDQHIAEINEEVASLKNGRADFEKRIETSVLSIYNRLLKANGTPLVKVSESGICGNCHLKITPQTWTEAKKGAVINCDNCSHLIYIEA
jgi:predicted  nucleic acid-binding Zn-ribbon protein